LCDHSSFQKREKKSENERFSKVLILAKKKSDFSFSKERQSLNRSIANRPFSKERLCNHLLNRSLKQSERAIALFVAV